MELRQIKGEIFESGREGESVFGPDREKVISLKLIPKIILNIKKRGFFRRNIHNLDYSKLHQKL